MRVGEITRKTHLSRPAVSHHIKVLKDAKGCQCKTCCDDEFLITLTLKIII
ncbi:ArsR/SmtB family transcription factor [Bacillus pacificus]